VDSISTVALLIDDLSSEDPNAKMHSISRISEIATLLGPDRCVEELIPMLTELIDKIDCNPELMMALAEQLGSLTKFLGKDAEAKAQNSVHLLKPLEIVAGSDDSVV
jgi:serine/threonine-protein phosphatase 2A regulatory subunit A